jgi:nucleotide-binding universal stress UspA family protein
MSIKTILIPFNGDERELAAADIACIIGTWFSSHLYFLHVSESISNIPFANVGLVNASTEVMVDKVVQMNKEKNIKAQKAFKECTSRNRVRVVEANDLPHHYVGAFYENIAGEIDNIVALEGKFNDLIVLGASEGEESSVVLTSAIFQTGKPLIFVPQHDRDLILENIVIAWKDSVQAARAVQQSIPLLKRAESIYIVTVKEHNNVSHKSAEKLAIYLNMHGIITTIIAIEEKDATGVTLKNKVEELRADMLVMGAFSHGRMRELVMGGITKFMLENSTIPLFLSH